MSDPAAQKNQFVNDGSFLEKFREIQRQKQAQALAQTQPQAPENSTSPPLPQSDSAKPNEEAVKKRKNRWDTPLETPTQPPVQLQPKKQVVVSEVYQPGMIKVGTKWMFPEDENIDGGTYEHKKRKKEMEETEQRARDLTGAAQRKGAHHLSDYLPKEELEKFTRKVEEAKTGIPQTQPLKLDESNKGFKLLKQAGWTEGKGLGMKEEGMTTPVEGSSSRPGNIGLGQEEVHEVTAEDDDFDTYRKRMMLAYKYRPNPLNNPRRSYY